MYGNCPRGGTPNYLLNVPVTCARGQNFRDVKKPNWRMTQWQKILNLAQHYRNRRRMGGGCAQARTYRSSANIANSQILLHSTTHRVDVTDSSLRKQKENESTFRNSPTCKINSAERRGVNRCMREWAAVRRRLWLLQKKTVEYGYPQASHKNHCGILNANWKFSNFILEENNR